MDQKKEIPAVPQELRNYLEAIPRAALAFSGGVDSSYLLYAMKACGVSVNAYYVNSQFQPQFELEDAGRLAKELSADMTVIPLDVLCNETVRANPADRCYHCKHVIFTQILEHAAADGHTLLMDGSNRSDDAGDRPGMRAVRELKVLSPLRETGLTKDRIRELSREAGLFTWDKPAYACLATRVPTGTGLDAQTLEKIENAESELARMGFTDFRVRVMGSAAKLQLPAGQIIAAAQKHAELEKALSEWFSDVLLDLKSR